MSFLCSVYNFFIEHDRKPYMIIVVIGISAIFAAIAIKCVKKKKPMKDDVREIYHETFKLKPSDVDTKLYDKYSKKNEVNEQKSKQDILADNTNISQKKNNGKRSKKTFSSSSSNKMKSSSKSASKKTQ